MSDGKTTLEKNQKKKTRVHGIATEKVFDWIRLNTKQCSEQEKVPLERATVHSLGLTL
jgi:hypothetical protein